MKIRCSSLHKIMGDAKGDQMLTVGAKSYLMDLAKREVFGFNKFDGSKETKKGNELEALAIRGSGMIRGKVYHKNTIRLENDWITGECDIHDSKARLIIDTKCSWDIGTHPFFEEEAKKKADKAGYPLQMQGYMWLFDCDVAEVDFWLFPCPEELLGRYDDRESMIDLVESIPLTKRVTIAKYARDETFINKAKSKIEACQEYYEKLIQQLN